MHVHISIIGVISTAGDPCVPNSLGSWQRADSPAQGCAGIDISTAGAPDRVVSHERLCKGIVHAAAIRELFLWRTRAELSAVPRNTEHELSEENQELEKVCV